MRPLGIDVSKYQTSIDYRLVAESGITFAYVKGSEDESQAAYRERAAAQLAGFREQGILTGIYHFARPDDRRGGIADDVRREAETFVAVLEELGAPGDLLPTLDLEAKASGVDGDELALWVRAFVRAVREATGRKVRLYTGAWFWPAVGSRLDDDELLADCPLWLAAYWSKLDPQVDEPKAFGPWKARGLRVGMWQYAGDNNNGLARVAGIAGLCDRNVFLGDDADLRAECGLAGAALRTL